MAEKPISEEKSVPSIETQDTITAGKILTKGEHGASGYSENFTHKEIEEGIKRLINFGVKEEDRVKPDQKIKHHDDQHFKNFDRNQFVKKEPPDSSQPQDKKRSRQRKKKKNSPEPNDDNPERGKQKKKPQNQNKVREPTAVDGKAGQSQSSVRDKQIRSGVDSTAIQVEQNKASKPSSNNVELSKDSLKPGLIISVSNESKRTISTYLSKEGAEASKTLAGKSTNETSGAAKDNCDTKSVSGQKAKAIDDGIKKLKKKKKSGKKMNSDSSDDEEYEKDHRGKFDIEELAIKFWRRDSKEEGKNVDKSGYEADDDTGKQTDQLDVDEELPLNLLLKIFERDRIFPLKKKSIRFPKARYFCRVCDYHMDTFEDVRRHGKDHRHQRRVENINVQDELKRLASPTPNQIESLDNLVEETYQTYHLSDDLLKERRETVEKLESFLRKSIPDCKLMIFGSSYSGLGLVDSDVNVDLEVEKEHAKCLSLAFKAMKESGKLKGKQDDYDQVVSDFVSKVPCIFFSVNDVNYRITISSDTARNTSRLLRMYTICDPRFKKLAVVFKYWAKVCKIDRQDEGTLPAYSFCLLLVYYLQQLKKPVLPVLYQGLDDTENASPVKNKSAAPTKKEVDFDEIEGMATCWKSENTDSVGSLWLGLFKYYVFGFDMNYHVISIRSLTACTRAQKKWNSKKLAIEDPFSVKRNVTKSVIGFELFEYVWDCVRKAYRYFGQPTNCKALKRKKKKKLKGKDSTDLIGEKGNMNTSEIGKASVKSDLKSESVNNELSFENGSKTVISTQSNIPEVGLERMMVNYINKESTDSMKENPTVSEDPVKTDLNTDNTNTKSNSTMCNSSEESLIKLAQSFVDDLIEAAVASLKLTDNSESSQKLDCDSQDKSERSINKADNLELRSQCDLLSNVSLPSKTESDLVISEAVKSNEEKPVSVENSSSIQETPSSKSQDSASSHTQDAEPSKHETTASSKNQDSASSKQQDITSSKDKADVSSELSSEEVEFKGIKEDAKAQYTYSFQFSSLTDGKGPSVYCSMCEKEGHLKSACPEETLPDLVQLPKFTKSHKEMLNLVLKRIPKDFGPSENEQREREMIRLELEEFIDRELYKDARVHLFGSSHNGFGFQQSDLDLCVTLDDHPTGEGLNMVEYIENITAKLKTHRGLYNVFPITTAKVPIVKFKHRRSQLEGDISMYNLLALQNTAMVRMYSQIDPRVRTLGYAVKVFAKICDIGDASRGSLSSYAYILMLLHYLQQCKPPVIPVLQELYKQYGATKPELMIDGWNSWYFDNMKTLPDIWLEYGKNNQSVGELWLGFFKYYTEEFNMKEQVVCCRQTEPLTKFEKLWNSPCIAIEDPFDLNHNLGGGLSRRMQHFIHKALIRGRALYGNPRPDLALEPKLLWDYFFGLDRLTEDGPAPNDRCCRACNKIGHIAKECPVVKNRKEREEKERQRKMEQHKKEREEKRNNANNNNDRREQQLKQQGYGREQQGYPREQLNQHGYGRDQQSYGREQHSYGREQQHNQHGYGREQQAHQYGYGREHPNSPGYGRESHGYGRDQQANSPGYGQQRALHRTASESQTGSQPMMIPGSRHQPHRSMSVPTSHQSYGSYGRSPGHQGTQSYQQPFNQMQYNMQSQQQYHPGSPNSGVTRSLFNQQQSRQSPGRSNSGHQRNQRQRGSDTMGNSSNKGNQQRGPMPEEGQSPKMSMFRQAEKYYYGSNQKQRQNPRS